MALAKYPQFGAQGGFVRATHTNRSEQAELQIGIHTEVLVKSTTKECSATRSDCSWGVAPDGDTQTANFTILDSIKLGLDDEIDVNYTAAQEYNLVTTGIDPDLSLLKAKCCIIKRAKATLTVEGKGDPGFALGTSVYPATLKTAIGTLDMIPIITQLESQGAVFRVISYTLNDTDQDWQKFTVEYQAFVDADVDPVTGQSSSIALPFIMDVFDDGHGGTSSIGYGSVLPPACDCPDTTCCDSYKIEWSLNGTGYSEITGTVTKNPKKTVY